MANGARVDLENPSTWQLRIRDHTLDDARLETCCPLDKSQYPTQSTQSLGQLDRLPSELLLEILLNLDIPTLVVLGRVNRRATNVISSTPQYSRIMKECPNVLRAIISTRANGFDLRTLHSTLSTSSCTNCVAFGGYLYIITCSRVCYNCYSSASRYFPMTGYEARRSGVSKNQLISIPHFYSLPGRYTSFEKLSRKRIKLFDRKAVTARLGTEGEDVPQDSKTREIKRYVAIISAPYFKSIQSVDWGVHCIACRESSEPTSHFRIKYSQNGIRDHINQFGTINDINGTLRHAPHP